MANVSTTGSIAGVTDWGWKMLILSVCLALLPQSPFASYVQLVDQIPYLRYLNWFVPISGIINVLQVYVQVVLIYYGYMVALRYSNGIKGGG